MVKLYLRRGIFVNSVFCSLTYDGVDFEYTLKAVFVPASLKVSRQLQLHSQNQLMITRINVKYEPCIESCCVVKPLD